MKLSRGKRFLVFCMGAAVLFVSCSSSDPYARVDELVLDERDYAGGLRVIDESLSGEGDTIYDAYEDAAGVTGANAISLLLDRGMISHYAGLEAQSIPERGPAGFSFSSENLAAAEEKIEDAKAGAAAQTLMSYISNDNAKDYAGEVYEDIYLTIFNALNYYQMGQIDNAIALARSVSEKVTAYSDSLGNALDAPSTVGSAGDDDVQPSALQSVLSSVQGSFSGIMSAACEGLGASREPLEFSNSALANYLAALAFRARGDTGSARVSIVNLNRAYAGEKSVYKNPVPASLKIEDEVALPEELQVPPEKARLNVIAFAGLSPVKQERAIPIPVLSVVLFPTIGLMAPISLFLPAMVDRAPYPAEKRKIEVSVENGPSFRLELLEDISAVIKGVFRQKLTGIIFKTVLRVAAKYIVVEASARQTDNVLVQLAIGAAGKAAIDASEGADIRMGHYFPGAAYVGGLTLDPGVYTITIKYDNGYTLKKENVELKAGGLNLLEAVDLR